ncbi:MAG TPA: PfkB family carbohydrate kinase [Candidatus Acidoferrum sp.]|nr:PfkB family carbohydrate kinase [Candidatus Acidoferrum sp.]
MILSIGDLLLDITIIPDGPLRPDDDRKSRIGVGGGGQAANFCAWAAALGEPVRLVTRVGDDDRGRRLVADLEARGVEVCPVWADEPTGAIAVLVGPGGQRSMATERGASVGLRPDDLVQSWFEGVQLIHVPAYSLFLDPLAKAARAAISLIRDGGGMLSVDLSSVAGLEDYGPTRMAYDLARLKPELLFGTAAEVATIGVAAEHLAQVPVIKLGAAGCSVFGRVVPAPSVQNVDGTGAGDAFAAAFCAAWIHGATPFEAAERAVVVASEAVTRTGARPS